MRPGLTRRLRPKRAPRLSRNTWALLLILALLGVATWLLTPSGSAALDRDKAHWGMRLGLDLAGGSHLVYEADFEEGWDEGRRAFEMERAVETIRKRIDRYGVTEPIIQTQEGERILIQLPGITNVSEAKSLIEQTGFLEFREPEVKTDGQVALLSDYLEEDGRTAFFDTSVNVDRIFARIYQARGEPEEKVTIPYRLVSDDNEGLRFVDQEGATVDKEEVVAWVEGEGKSIEDFYSWMPARGTLMVAGEEVKEQLTGAYLTEALPYYPTPEELAAGAETSVNLTWNADGAKLFDQVAARLNPNYTPGSWSIKACLGIFLDGEVLSYPQMLQSEYHGKGSITGNFTWDEARLLAIQLNSGALPMPLKQPPLYESEVSATLGADFVNRAVLAGGIGLAMVVLFMTLYYRLPGLLASLALLVYVAIVLAIFKLVPVTLTLAGVAGFILSIGMAVDANVLIFERMKEELHGGRTLRAAVETGFDRAWRAIRDSNISTFITCGILYWFGSSIVDSPPVMGFAVTLFIGVAVSMFSAIVVTRTFLRLAAGPRMAGKLAWFGVEAGHV